MQDTTKEVLRERILTLLRNQKEEERLTKSLAIQAKLLSLSEFKNALTILFYFPFDGEVDTLEMIKQAKHLGKTVGLPKINQKEKKIIPARVNSLNDELKQGLYGIKEPKDNSMILNIENIDMAVVPGVAFDKNNYRLGRGGGYYDRFLSEVPNDTPTVGLAFDFQIVENLPQRKEHDMPVSRVLTN